MALEMVHRYLVSRAEYRGLPNKEAVDYIPMTGPIVPKTIEPRSWSPFKDSRQGVDGAFPSSTIGKARRFVELHEQYTSNSPPRTRKVRAPATWSRGEGGASPEHPPLAAQNSNTMVPGLGDSLSPYVPGTNYRKLRSELMPRDPMNHSDIPGSHPASSISPERRRMAQLVSGRAALALSPGLCS